MSTHNIGFYEDLTKIIFKLSSNMHFISSSGQGSCFVITLAGTPERLDMSPKKTCILGSDKKRH